MQVPSQAPTRAKAKSQKGTKRTEEVGGNTDMNVLKDSAKGSKGFLNHVESHW